MVNDTLYIDLETRSKVGIATGSGTRKNISCKH